MDKTDSDVWNDDMRAALVIATGSDTMAIVDYASKMADAMANKRRERNSYDKSSPIVVPYKGMKFRCRMYNSDFFDEGTWVSFNSWQDCAAHSDKSGYTWAWDKEDWDRAVASGALVITGPSVSAMQDEINQLRAVITEFMNWTDGNSVYPAGPPVASALMAARRRATELLK